MFARLPDIYPDVQLALTASNRDQILRLFYGVGNHTCAAAGGLSDRGEERYGEGLSALYDDPLDGRFVLYEVDSDVYTWSTTSAFYGAGSAGVAMADRFAAVLAGPTHSLLP